MYLKNNLVPVIVFSKSETFQAGSATITSEKQLKLIDVDEEKYKDYYCYHAGFEDQIKMFQLIEEPLKIPGEKTLAEVLTIERNQ